MRGGTHGSGVQYFYRASRIIKKAQDQEQEQEQRDDRERVEKLRFATATSINKRLLQKMNLLEAP
jgi:hypothetical protein